MLIWEFYCLFLMLAPIIISKDFYNIVLLKNVEICYLSTCTSKWIFKS